MNARSPSHVGWTVLALVLLVAGCAGPSADRSPTTTASPTSTTGRASTTTRSVGGGCPDLPAGGSSDSEPVLADLDGDGAPDELSAHRTDGGTVLRAEFSAGGSAEAEVGDVGPVIPLGGVDLDGDGGEEAWVVVGGGAATQSLALFDLQGCSLVPVSPAGGLAVGASVRNASGIECQDLDGDGAPDVVVHAELSSEDGERYTGTATRYGLTGGGLELLSVVPVTASLPSPSPAFGGFACGDVRLGQSP